MNNFIYNQFELIQFLDIYSVHIVQQDEIIAERMTVISNTAKLCFDDLKFFRILSSSSFSIFFRLTLLLCFLHSTTVAHHLLIAKEGGRMRGCSLQRFQRKHGFCVQVSRGLKNLDPVDVFKCFRVERSKLGRVPCFRPEIPENLAQDLRQLNLPQTLPEKEKLRKIAKSGNSHTYI